MTATSSTLDSLLRAVCESPESDMPRLCYADALQERVDCTEAEAKYAEFIRVQCELARPYHRPECIEGSYTECPGCIAKNNRKWLSLRERELLREWELAWRRPVCQAPLCVRGYWKHSGDPNTYPHKCPACNGTGSDGPLSLKPDNLRVHRETDVSFWKHAVTWSRGFPVVECTLAELGEEAEERYCDAAGDMDTRRIWQPSAWAMDCVRRCGASFVVGMEPAVESGGVYTWERDTGTPHSLPTAIFRELPASSSTAREWGSTSLDMARELLNAAITRLTVRAVWPKQEG